MHYPPRRGPHAAALLRKLTLLLPATLLLTGVATPALAQGTLQGRVEKDSTGVADVAVMLHRVTRDSAGAVSTSRSGPGGAFSFTLPPADTAGFTVFFATAEYQGVRYFGPPLHSGDSRSGYSVEVFDTATITPGALPAGVSVMRRDVILIREPQGGWEVNEVLQLRNQARRTWVPESGRPSWEFQIPPNVGAFEVGEGGTPPDEVQLMGDRVLVMTALTPTTHEVLVRYRLPVGTQHYAVTPAMQIDTFQLFVRLPAPQLELAGVSLVDTVTADDQRFARYSAVNVEAGTKLSLGWQGPAAAPFDPLKAAIGALLLVLGGGVALALRNRRTSPPTAREPAVPHEPAQTPVH